MFALRTKGRQNKGAVQCLAVEPLDAFAPTKVTGKNYFTRMQEIWNSKVVGPDGSCVMLVLCSIADPRCDTKRGRPAWFGA